MDSKSSEGEKPPVSTNAVSLPAPQLSTLGNSQEAATRPDPPEGDSAPRLGTEGNPRDPVADPDPPLNTSEVTVSKVGPSGPGPASPEPPAALAAWVKDLVARETLGVLAAGLTQPALLGLSGMWQGGTTARSGDHQPSPLHVFGNWPLPSTRFPAPTPGESPQAASTLVPPVLQSIRAGDTEQPLQPPFTQPPSLPAQPLPLLPDPSRQQPSVPSPSPPPGPPLSLPLQPPTLPPQTTPVPAQLLLDSPVRRQQKRARSEESSGRAHKRARVLPKRQALGKKATAKMRHGASKGEPKRAREDKRRPHERS